MTKLFCIMLLVALAIVIARCNGSSKLGRNLLVSLFLGVAVSLGLNYVSNIKKETKQTQIENIAMMQLPTQLGLPVEIMSIPSRSGIVGQVSAFYSNFLTKEERLWPNYITPISTGGEPIIWNTS